MLVTYYKSTKIYMATLCSLDYYRLGRVKVICRFWGRGQVVGVILLGFQVCKIRPVSTNSMLVFFEAVENKMKNGWLAGVVFVDFLLGYSALVVNSWMIITWVFSIFSYYIILAFFLLSNLFFTSFKYYLTFSKNSMDSRFKTVCH